LLVRSIRRGRKRGVGGGGEDGKQLKSRPFKRSSGITWGGLNNKKSVLCILCLQTGAHAQDLPGGGNTVHHPLKKKIPSGGEYLKNPFNPKKSRSRGNRCIALTSPWYVFG